MYCKFVIKMSSRYWIVIKTFFSIISLICTNWNFSSVVCLPHAQHVRDHGTRTKCHLEVWIFWHDSFHACFPIVINIYTFIDHTYTRLRCLLSVYLYLHIYPMTWSEITTTDFMYHLFQIHCLEVVTPGIGWNKR